MTMATGLYLRTGEYLIYPATYMHSDHIRINAGWDCQLMIMCESRTSIPVVGVHILTRI